MVYKYGGFGNSNVVGSLGNDVLYGGADPNLNLPNIVAAPWSTELRAAHQVLYYYLPLPYSDFSQVGDRAIFARVSFGDVYLYELVNNSWASRAVIEDNLVYRFGQAVNVELVEVGLKTFLFVSGNEGSSVFRISSNLDLINTQNWERLSCFPSTGPVDFASNSAGNVFVYGKGEGITTLKMNSSGVLSDVDSRFAGGGSNSGGEYVKVISVGSGYVAIYDFTTFDSNKADLRAYFIDSHGIIGRVIGVEDQNFASTYATKIDGRIFVATASNFSLNVYEVRSSGFELVAKVTDQSQFDITSATPIIFEKNGKIYVEQNNTLFQVLENGSDVMSGRSGSDVLYGAEGNDTIYGGFDNDQLFGGTGKDRLNEGVGNGSLKGEEGSDTLTGGSGMDKFIFNTSLAAGNVDTITDFNVIADTIRLENAIFKGIFGGILITNAFTSNNSGNATDTLDRIIYERDTGKLFFDRDGTGSAEKINFAVLDMQLKLTHADFFVF